jgi:single-strand DNA-binding protein
MSKGINKVSLLGHLGKDPEIRATQGGTIIANFSLATSDRRKDQHGDWQDATEWHNIVAFNRTAEICRDYLSKGSQVYIEGKIQTRSWEDHDSGAKKYRTEILVNELIMLGGTGEGNGQKPAAAAATTAQRTSRANEDYANTEITDDDIPF